MGETHTQGQVLALGCVHFTRKENEGRVSLLPLWCLPVEGSRFNLPHMAILNVRNGPLASFWGISHLHLYFPGWRWEGAADSSGHWVLGH